MAVTAHQPRVDPRSIRSAGLGVLVAILATSASAAAATQEPVRRPPNTHLPTGRLAPPTTVGPLSFTGVRIFRGRRFEGLANVTNAGSKYLNRLAIGWSIVGRRGLRLDHGSAAIGSLAPGETATITLTGSRRYSSAWTAVRFEVRF